MADELETLREEFPGFRIWREITGQRMRYIARSQHPGCRPHTVVTADPGEMRAELQAAAGQPQAAEGLPLGPPNIARVYSRWIGGKDSPEADRLAADAVLAEFPQVAEVARANREFVERAVAYAAAHGIAQYIDIGAGLPVSPSVHEIARRADPGSRVAYIDNDPVVLAQARAMLATGPGVMVAAGDMRRAAAMLASPDLLGAINLAEPVCMILAAVLHFVTPAEADASVAALTAALAPGSYLIVSAGTSTGTDPALIDRLKAAYQDSTVVTGRTETEIAAYFAGLDMVPPGLTDVWAWRPASGRYWPPSGVRLLGGVARKPASTAGTRASSPQ